MTVIIRETGRPGQLTLISPRSGLEWTTDLIGSTLALLDGQFVLDPEEDMYTVSQEVYNWWADYLTRYAAAEAAVYELLAKHGDDILFGRETFLSHYHNYIGGYEFNDLPGAMERFVADYGEPDQ